MSVLAVELGGSHIACGVVTMGKVLAFSSFATRSTSLRDLLPEIHRRLVAHAHEAKVVLRKCQGIAFGFPGLVDYERGKILSPLDKFVDIEAANLPSWGDREFGLPVKLENDAKLALLGEHLAGSAVGYQDVVMVTLGTGIGVAAMLQGKLVRSRTGHAGSMGGHLIINMNGRRCVCGAIGCAEAEASTSVLPAICTGWNNFSQSLLALEPRLDFATLFRCKDAGDQVAQDILDHCIKVWSSLAVSLVHAYGPEILLFGGGVMQRSEEILPAIRSFTGQHAWKSSGGEARIEASALGSVAALVGAACLFGESHP